MATDTTNPEAAAPASGATPNATERAPAAAPAKPTRASRSVWRPSAAGRGWWRSRPVRRGLVALLLLAMVGGLLYLVFSPLAHPNAQLVFMTGGDYRPLKAPPAAFALEDYDALGPLRSAL